MRCYFHLVSAHEEILDNSGVEVADLETARDWALTTIGELRQEADGADDWAGWRLDIVCPEGDVMCSLPLTVMLH